MRPLNQMRQTLMGRWLEQGPRQCQARIEDLGLFDIQCQLDEGHDGDHLAWGEDDDGQQTWRLTWPSTESGDD